MKYIVMRNQQIAIEAENPDEALKKVLNGEGDTRAGASYNIQGRPEPEPPPNPPAMQRSQPASRRGGG